MLRNLRRIAVFLGVAGLAWSAHSPLYAQVGVIVFSDGWIVIALPDGGGFIKVPKGSDITIERNDPLVIKITPGPNVGPVPPKPPPVSPGPPKPPPVNPPPSVPPGRRPMGGMLQVSATPLYSVRMVPAEVQEPEKIPSSTIWTELDAGTITAFAQMFGGETVARLQREHAEVFGALRLWGVRRQLGVTRHRSLVASHTRLVAVLSEMVAVLRAADPGRPAYRPSVRAVQGLVENVETLDALLRDAAVEHR